ncbi:YqzM family protein [Ferviditalea candida]|uniref:YqzM family protein n=1 Tax=Ferviditalea candida TaxID=3108399 RepID=A0ABU5ZD87_9BACL|nr:YqzM family protein [Paenibacillaceae bacterium T2]
MSETRNPELHVNEEPRNDSMDIGVGFGAMFTFILVVTIIATVVEVLTR